MKMLKSFSSLNITNVDESINQFFLYHENVKNLQSELAKIDAEMFLCEQLAKAFSKIDHNPFE